jgi:hypothetical protein
VFLELSAPAPDVYLRVCGLLCFALSPVFLLQVPKFFPVSRQVLLPAWVPVLARVSALLQLRLLALVLVQEVWRRLTKRACRSAELL